MSKSSNTKGTHERFVDSLKIATFIAVVGFVSLSAAPPSVLHSAMENLSSVEDGSYGPVDAMGSAAAEAPPVAAATAKPEPYYFPSQFQMGKAVADPAVPTF